MRNEINTVGVVGAGTIGLLSPFRKTPVEIKDSFGFIVNKVARLQKEKVEQGFSGTKTGKVFYEYFESEIPRIVLQMNGKKYDDPEK